METKVMFVIDGPVLYATAVEKDSDNCSIEVRARLDNALIETIPVHKQDAAKVAYNATVGKET